MISNNGINSAETAGLNSRGNPHGTGQIPGISDIRRLDSLMAKARGSLFDDGSLELFIALCFLFLSVISLNREISGTIPEYLKPGVMIILGLALIPFGIWSYRKGKAMGMAKPGSGVAFAMLFLLIGLAFAGRFEMPFISFIVCLGLSLMLGYGAKISRGYLYAGWSLVAYAAAVMIQGAYFQDIGRPGSAVIDLNLILYCAFVVVVSAFALVKYVQTHADELRTGGISSDVMDDSEMFGDLDKAEMEALNSRAAGIRNDAWQAGFIELMAAIPLVSLVFSAAAMSEGSLVVAWLVQGLMLLVLAVMAWKYFGLLKNIDRSMDRIRPVGYHWGFWMYIALYLGVAVNGLYQDQQMIFYLAVGLFSFLVLGYLSRKARFWIYSGWVAIIGVIGLIITGIGDTEGYLPAVVVGTSMLVPLLWGLFSAIDFARKYSQTVDGFQNDNREDTIR